MNNYYVYSTLFFANLDESVQFTRKNKTKQKRTKTPLGKSVMIWNVHGIDS